MWKAFLFSILGLHFFQTCFAISQDESVRSYLENFNTTRNNHVTPAIKTAARDYIVKTFQEFGLDTWTEEFRSNQKNFPGINIIGRVNGRYTGTSMDKMLIIAAHYDTEAGTKGVDDNGSGMTVLLQALRQYKSSNNMKCSQDHTLLFVAFDLEEVQQTCQAPPCSCGGGLCGSRYFVANLTRYLDNLKATVQGAYVLDTVMNYNTTPNSQNLPQAVQPILPNQYNWVISRNSTGDWLAIIGRKTNDSELSNQFVTNFKQGDFKVLAIPLPFNGKPEDIRIQNSQLYQGLRNFIRSDHATFWNSNNSWPAVHLTDTADFRGYMINCYHQQCDNMDRVTPQMITFMGRTADALVGAAQSMTKRVCPTRKDCKNVLIKGDKAVISSPYYPSQYPNGINCSWYQEPKKNHYLKFEDFDIEASSNCENDFLEVLEGKTADQTNNVIGRFCGSTKPSRIHVHEKAVRIRFVSDALVSRKGFQIIWESKAPGLSDSGRLGLLQVFCVIGVLIMTSSFKLM